MGTARSTTNTLLGRSERPDPSLCEVPVTTPAPEVLKTQSPSISTLERHCTLTCGIFFFAPHTRFFCCSRGILRGVAEKPGHSDTKITRMPDKRAASNPRAARPSSSADAIEPNEIRTGGAPAARNRDRSSLGVQPAIRNSQGQCPSILLYKVTI